MVKDTQGYRVFRVIKDELPSENSHLTIFMRTLKTRTAEAKQLGEIGTVLVASRVKISTCLSEATHGILSVC